MVFRHKKVRRAIRTSKEMEMKIFYVDVFMMVQFFFSL